MAKELRKVVLYKYERVKFSNRYEKVPDGHGLFHGFGVDYEELENGVGNYTTAIVEIPSGEIKNVPVELVIFNN